MPEYVCSGEGVISEILVAIYVMILQETKENCSAEVSVLNRSRTIWMRWSAILAFAHTIFVRVKYFAPCICESSGLSSHS